MMEFNEIRNPFPGLRPFELDESNLFFGREGQSDELLARLQRTRFLAVVGTSGSGKSSLIRAGLLPALYGGLMGGAGSSWRIAILRPGNDPIGNLAWALGQQEVFGADDRDQEFQNTIIETTLRRSTLGLVDATKQAQMSAHENLLIVVDQFEELFRFKEARKETGSEDDAAAFVKLLLEAGTQDEVPIYVVLTMRSDFLGDCSQFAGLPEAINQGQYLIPRMSRDERRAAITGPVAVGGGEITLPLVSRLLNDVGDNPDQLPILQHALMRTWDYSAAHRSNGAAIGLEDYEAIGTMSEALSQHADEAWSELDERGRLIAEILFRALTERGADNREIRRPTTVNAICEIAGASMTEVASVIEIFRDGGRSFLMPPVGVTLHPETVIDISHESLIRNWQRLKDWVNEEAQSARIYRRLSEAAVLHREGSEGLLQDPGLQIALDWVEKSKPTAAWAERYHPEFAAAIAYLEQSRAARDAALAESERRRNEELERERREREQAEVYAAGQARAARRLRWLAVGMAVMFLLALGTAAFAMAARKQAIDSEKKARDAQARAETAAREVAEGAALLKVQKDKAEGLAVGLGKQKHETDVALLAEQAAVEAQKKALVLQKQATARANDQKLAAESSQRDAQTNFVVAMISGDQSARHLNGIAEFQRGDYDQALEAFKGAMQGVEKEEEQAKLVNYSSQAVANKDVVIRELKSTRSSLLRDIASTQRKLGKYEDAVRTYTDALRLQKEYDTAMQTGDSWNLFDTTYGLAHAYRDLAAERTRTDRTKPHDLDYSKAEEQFKLALALQEKLLKDDQNNNETFAASSQEIVLHGKWALKFADSLEDFARFYGDRGRYGEAERYYQQILKIRSQQPNSPQYLNTLTETARFYQRQAYYYEATEKYEEVSRILESGLSNADDTAKGFKDLETVRQLAETYNEIGGALAAQPGNELKSRYAFQLARALQANVLWVRQGDSSRPEELKAALVNDESMGDAYVGLGKDDLARELYLGILPFAKLGVVEGEQLVRLVIKLGRIYGKSPKTYKDAESAYLMFVKATEEDPDQTLALAEGLQELGALYANALNEPAKAEDLLKRSRALVQHAPKDSTEKYLIAWKHLMEISPESANTNDPGHYVDNRALAGLAKLYQRQNKTVEAENAYKLRLENASKNLSNAQTSSGTADRVKSYAEAAREFLEANRELAVFYLANQKKNEARAVYRAMLGDPNASNPPTCCIPLNDLNDLSVLRLYVEVLDEYETLLWELDRREYSTVKDYLDKIHSKFPLRP